MVDAGREERDLVGRDADELGQVARSCTAPSGRGRRPSASACRRTRASRASPSGSCSSAARRPGHSSASRARAPACARRVRSARKMPPMPSVSAIVCRTPVARGDLEVEQRRLVAADLHHVEHEVGAVERRAPVEVRADRGAGAALARDVSAPSPRRSRAARGRCRGARSRRPAARGSARMSPSRLRVKTTLPAPTNATLVTPCSHRG